jgi:hypothetical protein
MSRFDQVPELRILLEGFILANGQIGAIKEVLKGVLVQNAVNEHSQVVPLEVDAIVAQPETKELAAAAFEASVFLEIGLEDFLGQAAKLSKDVKLKLLGHFG